ncbi:type IV secretion system DotC family protein [Legionella sp. W05-934-2]|jgi:defect-in-organelle-trafficking protein DotC|uniref:type IV secretion system DotC family protein n=1 Tax=Legionella sp. W05-934-2 TaxID=1198649 RepID=UPI003461FA32
MLKYILNLGIISLLLLGGCTSGLQSNQGDVTTLAGLQSMASSKNNQMNKTEKISRIREMALKETALSLGAQSGLAMRAKNINKALMRNARHLDQVFDFTALILEHNVMPPVLLSGRNTVNLADAQTIRVSDRTYKVAKQAHFISVPPTWRQYIWMDYKKPEYPHVSLLPKTKDERQVWRHFVEQGWNNGIEQANTILEERLASLQEDFVGMIRYRKLLAMNMVSPPFVADTDLGVTGDANEIHIDDRVLRITALPALNVNAKEWRAAVAKDEDALKKFRIMEKTASSAKIIITNHAWQPVIAPPVS